MTNMTYHDINTVLEIALWAEDDDDDETNHAQFAKGTTTGLAICVISYYLSIVSLHNQPDSPS